MKTFGIDKGALYCVHLFFKMSGSMSYLLVVGDGSALTAGSILEGSKAFQILHLKQLFRSQPYVPRQAAEGEVGVAVAASAVASFGVVWAGKGGMVVFSGTSVA